MGCRKGCSQKGINLLPGSAAPPAHQVTRTGDSRREDETGWRRKEPLSQTTYSVPLGLKHAPLSRVRRDREPRDIFFFKANSAGPAEADLGDGPAPPRQIATTPPPAASGSPAEPNRTPGLPRPGEGNLIKYVRGGNQL